MNDETERSPDISNAAARLRPDELAGKLAALSHPARIGILLHLAGSGPCCCKQVVERFDLAQSTVSQHLKVLVDAGLVRCRRARSAPSMKSTARRWRRCRRRLRGWRRAAVPSNQCPKASPLADKTVSAESGSPDADAAQSLALYVAGRPRRPEGCGWSGRRSSSSPPSWCWSSRPISSNGRPMRWPARGKYTPPLPAFLLAPVMLVIAYNVVRLIAARPQPAARRALRQRRPTCGAPARLPHLRAYARAVAALSSGAAHRRPVAHHRARHQGHRDDRALHRS